MPFYVRIARKDDTVPPLRAQQRANGSSAVVEGVGSFARGVLFGFGMLVVLIVSLWIVDAAGVALPPEASALLDSFYGR